MRSLSFFILSFFIIVGGYAKGVSKILHSPDNSISFSVYIENGDLKYQVSFKEKPVILESCLGIDGWKNHMEIERIDSVSVNKEWHPVYGERAVISDCYNEYT